MKTLMSILIGLMAFTVVYNAYLDFYPFRTLEVKSATVTGSQKIGSLMTYVVDYCKYTDKAALVFRSLHTIDEKSIVPFPSVSTISVPGCNQTKVPLELYPTIEPGRYYLLVDVVFEINSQRRIHSIFRSNNFEIIK